MMNTRRYSQWDWPAALLLIAVVFTAAARLQSTNWTPDLAYVGTFGLLGTVLGLALGISQFQERVIKWLVTGYTVVFIPLHLSGIVTGEKTAIGKLASFTGRLAISFSYLFSGKAIEDHLFFVTLMSILFWAIGIYSGYRLIRHPAILPVLLPSIIPIVIVQYYDGRNVGRIWGLAVYFFIALILIGRMNFLAAQERWKQQMIMSGGEPEFDINRNIVVAAAMIIMAAWILPTPDAILPQASRAWQNFTQPFESTRQRLNDALAALHGSPVVEASNELYGTTMGLGRNISTGKDVVFSVQVPVNELPRLYWRMRVYDTYENGTWKSTNNQSTAFDPDKNSLTFSDIEPGSEGKFIFTWNNSPSSLLATPSWPVWTSRTGSIQTSPTKSNETDLLNWNVKPSLQTGDQYQVRALLLNPTRKELRNAGVTYPAWVTERYLEVPADLKPKLNQLAKQITEGQTTAFDQAEAITDYLRQNMTYSETIPAPPLGDDPVSWFLFNYKNGFCNYYASSEVLLLRSIGIPTRMVVGYAQGKSDGVGIYSIRGQDAHAWPEVYFPNIGWVEFEPTVNQLALVRPSGDAPAPSTNTNRLTPDELDARRLREREPLTPPPSSQIRKVTFLGMTQDQWLWIIISVSVVAVVGFSTWQLERRKPFIHNVPHVVRAIYIRYNAKSPTWLDRWVRWSEVTPIERAFHSINQCLGWLHKPQPAHVTAAERAQLLKNLVPQASSDIDNLTAALEQTLYTSHPAEAVDAFRAGWRIRIATLRQIVLHRFNGE